MPVSSPVISADTSVPGAAWPCAAAVPSTLTSQSTLSGSGLPSWVCSGMVNDTLPDREPSGNSIPRITGLSGAPGIIFVSGHTNQSKKAFSSSEHSKLKSPSVVTVYRLVVPSLLW